MSNKITQSKNSIWLTHPPVWFIHWLDLVNEQVTNIVNMTFVYNCTWEGRCLAPSLATCKTAMASSILQALSVLTLVYHVVCQYSGGRPINPGRETFTPPPPGDPNYRTYVYNSRRYGQALPARPFIPSYNDPNLNPNSYDPNINRGLPPGEDPNRYMFNDVSEFIFKQLKLSHFT